MRFTVRRPPTGEVSPCCHRPSGGDVARSIDVGVAPASSAGLALEDRLALAVLGCNVPARGAALRSVRSRDLLDPAQSLVLQTCYEPAPTASADPAVEPPLLGDSGSRLLDGAARGASHRPDIQLLDPDRVEPAGQVGGGLLDPIFASITLAGLQLRTRAFRLLPAVGTTLTARDPLLQHVQPRRLARRQNGCVQQFAGGQRGRHDHAAVDTDHAAVARTGDGVGDVYERDMPSASPITSDPVGLHTLRHRLRQPQSHPPDFGNPHPTESAVQPLNVMWFQPDLPKPFVHIGFPPGRAAVCAVEEVLHRLCEVPERLLLDRLTPRTKPRVLGAGFRQLRALLTVAGSLATRLPVLLLIYRQIPYIPRIPAVTQQRLFLLRSRQQPKPRHIRTVTTPTDTPDKAAQHHTEDRLVARTKVQSLQPKETR